jgi:hypothetical protein
VRKSYEGMHENMKTSSVSNAANQQLFADKTNLVFPKQILSAIQQVCFLSANWVSNFVL